jgi:hypothetical protein
MKKNITLLLLGFTLLCIGQKYEPITNSYDIEFNFPFYKNKPVYLTYHLQGSNYVKDTLSLDNTGSVRKTFNIPKGQYNIYFADADKHVNFFVDNEKYFAITLPDINKGNELKFYNSRLNSDYVEFQNALNNLGQKLEDLGSSTESDEIKSRKSTEIYQSAIQLYQRFADKNPKTVAGQSVAYEYTLLTEPAEDPLSHYSASLNVFDQSSYYIPNFYQILNRIIDNQDAGVSDKMMQLNALLNESMQYEFGYKNLMIYLLNYAAKSRQLFAEDLYCHLAQHYNNTVATPWIDDKQRKAILDNAAAIKPTLSGNKATDLGLERNKIKTSLYSLTGNSSVILIFFNENKVFSQSEINGIKMACDKISQQKNNSKIVLVYIQKPDLKNVPSIFNDPELTKHSSLLMTITQIDEKGLKDYNFKGNLKTYKLNSDKIIEYKRFGLEQLDRTIL